MERIEMLSRNQYLKVSRERTPKTGSKRGGRSRGRKGKRLTMDKLKQL